MLLTTEKLRIAYDEEVQNHTTPATLTDLPLSYEEITNEWLTAVICRNATPEAKVIAHKLGEVDDGNTSRRRIFLTYNSAGEAAGLPATVFCKSSCRFSTRISVGIPGGIEAEVTFYKKLRSMLAIEAPQAIWAHWNPDNYNSIVMLEDIGEGTEFCTLQTNMTRERAQDQMALLAHFHGQFYAEDAQKHLTGLATWSEFFMKAASLGFEEFCGEGFSAARAVIPPRLYSRAAKIWPATLKAIERNQSLPKTLLHGDVHLRNWYITSPGKMGLTDWQNTCRGHWAHDVSYTMATSISVEQRREMLPELLKFYIDELYRNGGPRVSYEQALEHYKYELFPALAYWTVTLRPTPGMPAMQPAEASLEMIHRITHAIDDLDAL